MKIVTLWKFSQENGYQNVVGKTDGDFWDVNFDLPWLCFEFLSNTLLPGEMIREVTHFYFC